MLTTFINTLMSAEAEALCGAVYGQSSPERVNGAVAMAVTRRGGHVAGLIHHSDHGSEYSSHDLERALRAAGITASMGSVGDCFDCEDPAVVAAAV